VGVGVGVGGWGGAGVCVHLLAGVYLVVRERFSLVNPEVN